MNSLLLKWGTVKGWNFHNECESWNLLKKYLENSSISCANDNQNDGRKKLLCEIIEKFDGIIQNDWTGEIMTKDEAKKYVINYDGQ